jgi:hypothetical protein
MAEKEYMALRDMPLRSVPVSKAARFFAGLAESFHNHPLIYAFGGPDPAIGGLVVVTRRGERRFSIADCDAAFAYYREELKNVGY